MKYAYPIIIKHVPDESGIDYLVSLPDFDAMSQGESVADAILMSEDLVSLLIMDREDNGESLPAVSDLKKLQKENPDDIVTLVSVNMERYRRLYGSQSVKKTLTIPAWLNTQVEEAGINFSRTLQEALMEKLDLC